MHEDKLSKIIYALEIDAEPSAERRAVMRKRGGMSHLNRDELAAKWKARMKTTKYKKRAEVIYAQYEANLAAISAGKAPEKASPANTLIPLPSPVPLLAANLEATPGLIKRAGSLAKAIGSETKAIVQKQPTLTAQQVAARLAVCGSCDQLRSNRTCAKCGCFVDAKARFRSQDCPLRRWPAR